MIAIPPWVNAPVKSCPIRGDGLPARDWGGPNGLDPFRPTEVLEVLRLDWKASLGYHEHELEALHGPAVAEDADLGIVELVTLLVAPGRVARPEHVRRLEALHEAHRFEGGVERRRVLLVAV